VADISCVAVMLSPLEVLLELVVLLVILGFALVELRVTSALIVVTIVPGGSVNTCARFEQLQPLDP